MGKNATHIHLQETHLKYKDTNTLKATVSMALAGVAQWIERGPVNQRIASSLPSEGTCLGILPRQVPSRGRMRGNHTLMFPSLSPSLPPVTDQTGSRG